VLTTGVGNRERYGFRFFRPYGAWAFLTGTHGLRRGLHSFAALRL
jgi:hypothetical protein